MNSCRLRTFRQKLDKEHDFFHYIFEHQEERGKLTHFLASSTINQLRLLLIHCVTGGDIPVDHELYRKIVASKKRALLRREFEREKEVNELMTAGRGKILTVLKKLLSILGVLVSPLFVKNE